MNITSINLLNPPNQVKFSKQCNINQHKAGTQRTPKALPTLVWQGSLFRKRQWPRLALSVWDPWCSLWWRHPKVQSSIQYQRPLELSRAMAPRNTNSQSAHMDTNSQSEACHRKCSQTWNSSAPKMPLSTMTVKLSGEFGLFSILQIGTFPYFLKSTILNFLA